jgi:hypothetical protein
MCHRFGFEWQKLASAGVLLFCALAIRGADVNFYGIAKTQRFAQVSSAAPTLNGGSPYRSGAAAGPATSGSITNGSILGPGTIVTAPLSFNPVNGWFDVTLKWPSLAAMDAATPAGAYTMTIDTLHDGQRILPLTLPAETAASFPPAPHVSNWAAAQSIDPTRDFTLTWDAFTGGTANDYILVLVGDQATGTVLFRTSDFFQPGALNGTTTSLKLSAATLQSGKTYAVEIQFYKVVSVNTTSYPGVPGIVAFQSYTDLNITTTTATTLPVDVHFYGIDKSQKFNQGSSDLPTLGSGNPYRFGAAAGPAGSGSIANGSISGPGTISATSMAFDAFNGWFDLTLKWPALAAMDTAAPAGAYTMVIDTLHDGQRTLPLTLPAETLTSFPPAPHVSNWTAAQSIDATRDFALTWDLFTGGTANDYILVLVGDQATSGVLFRTPDFFQPGALNGMATSLKLPGATLQPGKTYTVEIQFYKVVSVNTTGYPGVPGIVAFQSYTDLNITTTSVTTPAQFAFGFRLFANGGSFLDSTQATPSFPVAINGYRAGLVVSDSANFPSPDQVSFTGPAASELNATASDASAFSSTTTNAFYYSPKITQPAIPPGGAWSVLYGNSQQSFSVPDPQAAARLVVPVPNVSVTDNIVKSLSWTYYDPNGNAEAGTPPVVTEIRVQSLDPSNVVIHDSGFLPAATSSYTLTSSLNWMNVNTVRLLYKDSLSNFYVVGFSKVTVTTPLQLQAVSSSAAGFVFRLSGQEGHGYKVQYSPDLAHWTDLVTTNLPTTSIQLVDPQSGQSAVRFYRASLVN